MESPPTSSIQFLNQAGIYIDAPIEWTPARIVLPVNELEDSTRLYCQPLGNLSLSVRLIGGQRYVTADWPRADPGHYHLALHHENQFVTEQIVTVQPRKISADAYNYMLEDLDQRLPALISLGLQRAGALAELNLLPSGLSTLAQELIRLRRAIEGSSERPGLLYVLKKLIHAPHEIHKILKASEEWVPRAYARRPHPSRLALAMARPGNVAVTKLPFNVLDTQVEHSFDTYENQLLKYYTFQVSAHLQRLIESLENKPRQNKALQKAFAEVGLLQKELTNILQEATFLREVSQSVYLPTQITMVLLKHPLYSIMFEGFLEFQRSPTVRLEEPALDAPLENLPKLYQVWGTLHVLEALLSAANELGYEVEEEHLSLKDENTLFVRLIPNGKPAVKLVHPDYGTTVWLIPEHTYKKQGTLYSTTYNQRPDIVIEVRPSSGHKRVYLFDPKYKLESEKVVGGEVSFVPKKEDIDKMHVYHDAIRDQEGKHVVAYAAILYPGMTQHYQTENIEALQAYPEAARIAQLGQRLRDILLGALQYRE